MTRKDETTKKTGLILIAILGSIYLYFTYINTKNSLNYATLQVAKTIEASLPKKEFQKLEGTSEDLKKPEYKAIKNTLQTLVHVSKEAQASYIYTEKNGVIYHIADSEPINSKYYGAPGRKCSDADAVYHQPFKDNKAIVTTTFSKIWGTWITALVPIKDPVTKKTTAVLAMDYSIDSWKYTILLQVAQSVLIIIMSAFLFLLLIGIKTKNKLLQMELEAREKADAKLKAIEEKHKKTLKMTDYN